MYLLFHYRSTFAVQVVTIEIIIQSFCTLDCDYLYVSKKIGSDHENCGRNSTSQCKTLQYCIRNISKENDEIQIDGGEDYNHPLLYTLNETIEITKELQFLKQGKAKPNPVITILHPEKNMFIFHLKEKELMDFHVTNIDFQNIPHMVYSELNGHIHIKNVTVKNASKSIFKLSCNNEARHLHLHVHHSKFINCHDVLTCNLQIYSHLRFKNCTFRNFTQTLFNLVFTKGKQEIIFSNLIFQKIPLAMNISATNNENKHNVVGIKGSRFEDITGDTAILLNNVKSFTVTTTSFIASSRTFESSFHAMDLNNTQEVLVDSCLFINHKKEECTNLIANHVMRLKISNSSFVNNTAVNRGGCLCINNSAFVIKSTKFRDNESMKGGAIYTEESYGKILNSSFRSNIAKQNGGAIFSSDTCLQLVASNFTENCAQYEGGAIYHKISKENDTRLTLNGSSYFINNSAKLFGGAIYFDGGENCINKTFFYNNIAELSGGAFYIERGGSSIFNSSFHFNTGNSSGGSIFQAGLSRTLHLENIDVSSTDKNAGIIGTTIHSQSKTIAKNINVTMILSKHDPLDSLQGVLLPKSKVHNLTFSCSSNYKIRYKSVHRESSNTSFLHVACIACSKGLYTTVGSSTKFLNSKETIENQAMCRPCPSGGVCTKYVLSRDNFWGFTVITKQTNDNVDSHQHIAFIPCPETYCCSRKTKNCSSFNTCSHNREGRICGKCQKNFTLNYFSGQCVKQSSDCNVIWFWIIFTLFVIFQSLFHMYLKSFFVKIKEIVIHFKHKLIKLRSPRHPSMSLSSSSSLSILDSNTVEMSNHINEEANEESECENTTAQIHQTESTQLPPNSTTQESSLQSNSGEDNKSFAIYMSGLKKIIFFFYQTIPLLHVTIPSKNKNWLHDEMTTIIGLLFNFDFQINLCPTSELSAIERETLHASPVFLSVFFIMVIKYLFSNLRKNRRYSVHVQLTEQHVIYERNFQLRSKTAIVELLLVGFVVISGYSLNMVNCVSINDQKYLYKSGETVCHIWWQYVLLVFIAIWVLPFGIAIKVGTTMLHEKHIQPASFYHLLMFPLILLPYHSVKYMVGSYHLQDDSKEFENGSGDAHTSSNEDADTEINNNTTDYNSSDINNGSDDVEIERKELLEIFQLPYREKTPCTETVFIYIRLALTIIATFIINPVPRLFITFPVLLAFLIYHDLYTPFRNKLLNSLQRVSLTGLLLLNTINLAWAYDYMNDVSSMPGWELISQILSMIQGVVLFIPFISVLLVLMFRFVKILSIKLRA